MRKRVIAAFAGSVYAVIYGFWTMLLTGGGHGNFVWIGLFIFVEFFGLYFPLMAFLTFGLKSFSAKLIYTSLILFNLLASTVMILGWITEPATERASDFDRTVQLDGIGFVLITATIHFLPTLIFAGVLVKTLLTATSEDREDNLLDLKLS